MYMGAHDVERAEGKLVQRGQNEILRCIMRKTHQRRSVVYLAYINFGFGVSDKIRRSIAQFERKRRPT